MVFSVGDRLNFTGNENDYWYAYALCDSRDDVVRYVGHTHHPLRRVKEHLRGTLPNYRGPKALHAVRRWVHACISSGACPHMRILAVVSTQAEAYRKESLFRAKYKDTIVNASAWWMPIPPHHSALSAAAKSLGVTSLTLLRLLASNNIHPQRAPYKGCTVTTISHAEIETVRASEVYRRRRTRAQRGSRSQAQPDT